MYGQFVIIDDHDKVENEPFWGSCDTLIRQQFNISVFKLITNGQIASIITLLFINPSILMCTQKQHFHYTFTSNLLA